MRSHSSSEVASPWERWPRYFSCTEKVNVPLHKGNTDIFLFNIPRGIATACFLFCVHVSNYLLFMFLKTEFLFIFFFSIMDPSIFYNLLPLVLGLWKLGEVECLSLAEKSFMLSEPFNEIVSFLLE